LTSLWAILGVLLASIFTALGALFLKLSSANFSLKPNKIFKNYFLLTGIMLYILSACLLIPSLRYGELSVLYPIMATSYISTCILSTKYLHEKMNTTKWLGIVLIVIGISLIGFAA